MKEKTRKELWSALRQAALVQGDLPEGKERPTPWFVRVMLGGAGWLGALFLLGFVATLVGSLFESRELFWMLGAAACGCAAVLYHVRRDGDFTSQFGLAVSLAGQIMMTFGMSGVFDRPHTAFFAAVAGQQAILFVVMPNFVHRVWAAWSGLFALGVAMHGMMLGAFTTPLITIALAMVWLREFDHPQQGALLRAAGYGLALAAAHMSVMDPGIMISWQWMAGKYEPDLGMLRALAYAGAATTVVVVMVATVLLMRREKVPLSSGAGRLGLALGVLLAVLSIWAPGIVPAGAILVLGVANGNRVLAGLGIVALLAYLSHYYYSLHATLLEKSTILMAAGLALLALRLIALRCLPAPKEKLPYA